jgi:hypothetical protein
MKQKPCPAGLLFSQRGPSGILRSVKGDSLACFPELGRGLRLFQDRCQAAQGVLGRLTEAGSSSAGVSYLSIQIRQDIDRPHVTAPGGLLAG